MILNRNIRNTLGLISLAVFLFFAAGCVKKIKIEGDEFIVRETLVDVITDIYLLDGITNDMSYYRKFNPVDSVDLYSSIFEKHNVTSEMYELTLKEYSKYPQLLDNVYDEVIMQLTLLQDKVNKEEDTKLPPPLPEKRQR